MAYLVWYRKVLELPVQNGTKVHAIEPLPLVGGVGRVLVRGGGAGVGVGAGALCQCGRGLPSPWCTVPLQGSGCKGVMARGRRRWESGERECKSLPDVPAPAAAPQEAAAPLMLAPWLPRTPSGGARSSAPSGCAGRYPH